MDPERKMATANPWKRGRPEHWDVSIDVDVESKRVALKASPSVVSLVSRRGEEALFMGSGTIIDSEDVNGTYSSTILSSASLLRSSPESDVVPDGIKIDVHLSDGKLFEGQAFAYDFHFNLAFVKIESDAALPTAVLRHLNDGISVDPKGVGAESSVLRPHSKLFKLCPGDMVVALGRHFADPYLLMAAPGKFSLDCCKYDCKELFRANCLISKCGIGGPLVNRCGEVIGVNFYDVLCTPFLPINIASKCLEQFKKYGSFRRPWLGMEMTNLYAARVDDLEFFLRNFPNISEGVFVEKVKKGSSAESAGILSCDVIVKCANKFVRSFLELYGILLDKAGEAVEVIVIRKARDSLHVSLKIDETSPGNFNRWPLPE